ncbi:integrin alpha-6-like isoform X2 [Notolabrus celidotus]|uniref:integrin alpha-6-like isoform X2 n=1 Tax=Notolabrus celidotus TaxID=1203425 RepID=UPI00148F7677|nr:integrin alpha-6-like isoform X2 [Notolabrus celidotus]
MEGSRITSGLWLFVFLSGCGRLSGFNLDTENVLKKTGEPGSLFGFSLAMHWQLEPVERKLLLVGAPKAKALSRQKSSVTGGLYSCDMTSDASNCDRVQIDNSEDLKSESKENQWLGATVSSQGPGGQVLTCAHRYQRRANMGTRMESREIIGRCILMNQRLTTEDTSNGEGDDLNFCENRGKGHELYSSCQQGVAAVFDKDYHYLIFGAPGAFNWKGVVRLENRNNTMLAQYFYSDGPFEAGDENEKNPDLVPAPVNSYLGFSLDSGKSLTTKGQLTVVAGAPRANYSGGVVLLKKGDNRNILLEEYTLEGEGLASSFGYDLTVLDLNKDGWQDIVVGAPQYFEKQGEIGGAVYVYVNKGGKWDKVKPIRIDGPQNSMFGLAVQSLGDINQDRYHDFAVGAPYDNEGAGNVYIYHGSATGLKSTKAAQVLYGKSLGTKLFGYSLAGNMDLDKNSYPDLAIGSLSDAVFVFRARPVVTIKKEVKFTPNEIDLTNKNCGNNFCMDIEACFTYTANPKSYSPTLKVAYSIQADADLREKKLNSRATFVDSPNNFESKGVVTITGQGQKQCIKRQLAIQENIRDKLRGIPIDVSVEIPESKRKRRQSSSAPLAPVMDANEPAISRSEVNFLKVGCGTDNVCQSNLQINYRYGHRPMEGDQFTALPLENGVPVVLLSDQKDIVLEVKVTNKNGDDAHEASVLASFPRSLSYSAYRVPTNEQQVTCMANKDGSEVDCELGNPFKRDSEAIFYIYLSTSGISLDTTEMEVNLQLNTTSDQQVLAPVKAKARVAITLQLSVTGIAQPSQLYFAGSVKGEAAMKTETDIGSAVTHQFKITNMGKRLTGFGTATLNIYWPKDLDSGKWLLYLVSMSSTGVEKMQCSPKGVVNPLNTELSKPRMRRAADTSKDISEGTISRLVDKNKFKTLSCDDGAKCVKIQCPLGGLDSNAVITLHSRLWNSTFIEDFSDLHHVEVIVKATLQVDSTVKNTVLQNAETQARLTVYPERRAEGISSGVPWWIIFLSVLFGLMLLALLAFLLWKCGLFGNKKQDPSEKERLTA